MLGTLRFVEVSVINSELGKTVAKGARLQLGKTTWEGSPFLPSWNLDDRLQDLSIVPLAEIRWLLRSCLKPNHIEIMKIDASETFKKIGALLHGWQLG